MKLTAFLSGIIFFLSTALSQPLTERYSGLGTMFVQQFSSAPFPDSLRSDGHMYGGKLYSAADHYSDSSVAIFVPNGFRKEKQTDVVVYFHGWNNNIDSACTEYRLIDQFSAAKKNAIFIFPEGPKDAPDSYGGRMERTNGLKLLLSDVMKFLRGKNLVGSEKIGKILIAGHSGAYHVISFCVMRGGMTSHISDVVLFDALYGETEKFAYWIDHYKGRFVDIYTDSGGTKYETQSLMADLDAWHIPYCSKEEHDLTLKDLKNNKNIFIHSDLVHNDVVAVRDQFQHYLETSSLPGIRKSKH